MEEYKQEFLAFVFQALHAHSRGLTIVRKNILLEV